MNEWMNDIKCIRMNGIHKIQSVRLDVLEKGLFNKAIIWWMNERKEVAHPVFCAFYRFGFCLFFFGFFCSSFFFLYFLATFFFFFFTHFLHIFLAFFVFAFFFLLFFAFFAFFFIAFSFPKSIEWLIHIQNKGAVKSITKWAGVLLGSRSPKAQGPS